MNRFLYFVALIAGLATLCWVGLGYVGVNPLALVMTVVMTGFFLMGALELHRFGQATAGLSNAVAAATPTPADLGTWLASIPLALQNAVRLRIEGERVGLPGPGLTPYLAGLLVLLGMLGTFMGMVVTLKGTGLALDSATDLQSIRDSLSAPVKGLGLAFGTSVAGVAASAMLGLMSALRKTERLAASQALDACVATSLRVFSRAHQREQSFQLLQQQASLLPELVGQMQSWMNTMAAQDQRLKEGLLDGQQQFHRQTEAAYTGLASSVDRSLQQSVQEGARLTVAALQPLVEGTLAGLARDTASLQQTITSQVQHQLDGLRTEFKAATTEVAGIWKGELSTQAHNHQQLATDLRGTLDQFSGKFEERSAALVDAVTQRLEHSVTRVSDQWQTALAEQTRSSQALSQHTEAALNAATAGYQQVSADLRGTLDQFSGKFEERSASLVDAVTQRLEHNVTRVSDQWQTALAEQTRSSQALSQHTEAALTAATAGYQQVSADLRGTLDQFSGRFDERSAALVGAVTQQLENTVGQVAQHWNAALAEQSSRHEALTQQTQAALTATTRDIKDQAAALVSQVAQTQADTLQAHSAHETERLAAWTASLKAVSTELHSEWQQTSAAAKAQWQALSQGLEKTSVEMSARNEQQAQHLLAEMAQLVRTVSDAPRAAAEVMAELRQKLSDSMARDNSMLEERSRILETLSTLLDAVNHASTEQRAAIDALVTASSDMLERVGGRITQTLEQHTQEMGEAAVHMTSNAVEVASLSEAFGQAVQLFAQSNEQLMAQLQRIEGALSQSMARSDEQLNYYVAQAREVIDLSISSQNHIVDELKQLARRRSPAESAA